LENLKVAPARKRGSTVVQRGPDASTCRKELKKNLTNAKVVNEVRDKTDEERDLEMCARMCKKYNLTHADVWWKMQEFSSCDLNNNRELDRNEFQNVIRKHVNLPGNGPLPKHLLNWHWLNAEKNNDGHLDFEEFLLWTLKAQYTEEVLVPDPQERFLRQIARENGVSINEAERLKRVFDEHDKDKKGCIEILEFRSVLYKLLAAKNESDISTKMTQRWWREIDHAGNGSISFEDFLKWYLTKSGLW